MSAAPSCLVVSLTSRSLSSGLDRSARIGTAVPPAARICSVVSAMVPGNGEPAGDLRADAAAGAGHDGDLAVQDAHGDHSPGYARRNQILEGNSRRLDRAAPGVSTLPTAARCHDRERFLVSPD